MTFDLKRPGFFSSENLNSSLSPLNFFFVILLLLFSVTDSCYRSLQLTLTFTTLNSLIFTASFITSFYHFYSENWPFTLYCV